MRQGQHEIDTAATSPAERLAKSFRRVSPLPHCPAQALLAFSCLKEAPHLVCFSVTLHCVCSKVS